MQTEDRQIPAGTRTLMVLGWADVVVYRAAAPALKVWADRKEDLAKLHTDWKDGCLTVRVDPQVTVTRGGTRVMADRGSVASDGDIHIGQNFGCIVAGRNVTINGRVVQRHGTLVEGGHLLVGIAVPAGPSSVAVRGSGDVALLDVDQDSLTVRIAGSGDVTAYGQVHYLHVQISGSGDVQAQGLRARSAVLSVAGSGDIAAWVDGPTTASVAGSGDIDVRGNPMPLTRTVAGSGEIHVS